MCLITKMTKPMITDKDIICYKVICKDMSSYIYNEFKWEFGKIYTSWIEVVERLDNAHEIHQAFHSYETLEDLKKTYFMVTVPCLAVKCTIPKGSTVYRGRHEELKGYASNQLIINEVIDTKELYPDFDWDNYPYKKGQVIQVKIPQNYWHDIIYGGEQVKFHDEIWKDYQITNMQLYPMNNTRVDLIIENCDNTFDSNFIITKFDGVAWLTEKEVRLKENKEE